jgi:hypothetical protein
MLTDFSGDSGQPPLRAAMVHGMDRFQATDSQAVV